MGCVVMGSRKDLNRVVHVGVRTQGEISDIHFISKPKGFGVDHGPLTSGKVGRVASHIFSLVDGGKLSVQQILALLRETTQTQIAVLVKRWFGNKKVTGCFSQKTHSSWTTMNKQ